MPPAPLSRGRGGRTWLPVAAGGSAQDAGTARAKAHRLGSKRGAPGCGGPRTEKTPAANPRTRQYVCLPGDLEAAAVAKGHLRWPGVPRWRVRPSRGIGRREETLLGL